ncbi:uncharacterized protein LOC109515488 [Hippocampus comes]|uniref:uncharacterized protein LOC109515488 n=1 Tax=Hippocampus comes TaxID=109280 RepID=UPI00094E49F2|nr:PREDICTED: uncharacterized protein LOC109515488 [Hippocampus comes]
MGCTLSFMRCEEDFLPMPVEQHDDDQEEEEEEDKMRKKRKDCSLLKREEDRSGKGSYSERTLWMCPRRRGNTTSAVCSETTAMSLLLPEELEAVHSHTFREKTFKKSKTCSVCKLIIVHDGLVCRVCRIPCHKKCEAKVSSSCVPVSNYELVSEVLFQVSYPLRRNGPRFVFPLAHCLPFDQLLRGSTSSWVFQISEPKGLRSQR